MKRTKEQKKKDKTVNEEADLNSSEFNDEGINFRLERGLNRVWKGVDLGLHVFFLYLGD